MVSQNDRLSNQGYGPDGPSGPAELNVLALGLIYLLHDRASADPIGRRRIRLRQIRQGDRPPVGPRLARIDTSCSPRDDADRATPSALAGPVSRGHGEAAVSIDPADRRPGEGDPGARGCTVDTDRRAGARPLSGGSSRVGRFRELAASTRDGLHRVGGGAFRSVGPSFAARGPRQAIIDEVLECLGIAYARLDDDGAQGVWSEIDGESRALAKLADAVRS